MWIAGYVDLWDSSAARSREERAQISVRICEGDQASRPRHDGFMLEDGVPWNAPLSIIDTGWRAATDFGEDARLPIVFNGRSTTSGAEAGLESRGHRFKTNSARRQLFTLTRIWAFVPDSPARNVCSCHLGRAETKVVHLRAIASVETSLLLNQSRGWHSGFWVRTKISTRTPRCGRTT